MILESVETLEKATVNFEDLAQHINIPISIILEPIAELEETENLIEHSSSVGETCLVYNCPQININIECTDVALGEGKSPKSILTDEYYEELSFPHSFSTNKLFIKFEEN